MDDQQLRELVLDVLTAVAPDIERDAVEPAVRFRDQFDFDSINFLNFVIGLHERSTVDVPEADYSSVATLDGSVAYLRARLA